MLLTIANILFFLVAAAMIVLILLQRGAGAAAGSGFGAGASATVFGSRGSANFLSRSTAVLAGVFMVLALGMAMYAARSARPVADVDDLGVMGRIEVPSATPTPAFDQSFEVPAGAPRTDAPTVDAVPVDTTGEAVESSDEPATVPSDD
jgi:preprotein translocase subunit SecG